MGTNVMRMRRSPALSAVAIAIFVVLVVVGTLVAVVQTTGESFEATTGRLLPQSTELAAGTSPAWDFVLSSPQAVEILRHRPGLTPIDIVRTHAFGWKGLTISEVLRSTKLMEVLRHRQGLTLLDLVEIQ
jgi:hypothetical protein